MLCKIKSPIITEIFHIENNRNISKIYIKTQLTFKTFHCLDIWRPLAVVFEIISSLTFCILLPVSTRVWYDFLIEYHYLFDRSIPLLPTIILYPLPGSQLLPGPRAPFKRGNASKEQTGFSVSRNLTLPAPLREKAVIR